MDRTIVRNPAELLGLDTPPMIRLLRACGTPEEILCDASDHDRFLALAVALPLCEGHPLRDHIQQTLRDATGLTAPFCSHTADAYWSAWVEKHWYGREVAPTEVAAEMPACPHCAPPAPTILTRAELPALPDPTALCASLTGDADLADLAGALSRSLPPAGGPIVLDLPPDYRFIRPDPYHATLALRAVASGQATDTERHLLWTQALRILGESAGLTMLLLCGGSPTEVAALLAYLSAVRRLPSPVYLPDDPAGVALVSGLYPTVRTGYRLSETDTPADVAERRAAYAAAAPIGRAVILQ